MLRNALFPVAELFNEISYTAGVRLYKDRQVFAGLADRLSLLVEFTMILFTNA